MTPKLPIVEALKLFYILGVNIFFLYFCWHVPYHLNNYSLIRIKEK
jgi:hypothetical protein